MEQLKKFADLVNKVVAVFAIILFVILICACVLQVFFRFVLHDSLSWSEELARFCFIWMHLIGASLLCRSHEHATVTLILDMVKGKARIVLDLVIEAVILFDGIILLIYGTQLAMGTWGNPSPAMSFNMGIVNASTAVAGLLLIIQAVTMMAGNLYDLLNLGKGQAKEG